MLYIALYLLGEEQTAVILSRASLTQRSFELHLTVHECIRAHQFWPALCVFQHLDRCFTYSRVKIMAICLSPHMFYIRYISI